MYVKCPIKRVIILWKESTCIKSYDHQFQGRIQDFKLGGGAHLKKLRRAKKARKFLGYFVWKITIFLADYGYSA